MKRVAERRYSKTSKPFATPITLSDGTIDTSWYNAPASAGFTIATQMSLWLAPSDGDQIYFGASNEGFTTTAGRSRIYVQKDCVLRVVSLYAYAVVAGSNEDWSAYVYKGGVDNLVATVGAATNGRWWSNTNMALDFDAGDYFQMKLRNPTWATNPESVTFGGYLYFEG